MGCMGLRTLSVASAILATCVARTAETDLEPTTVALVEDLCAAIVTCGCDAPYEDPGECRAPLIGLFEREHRVAREAGFVYDEACVEQARARIEALACSDHETFDPAVRYCARYCQVFHGDRPAGSPCSFTGDFHDCERGLECHRDAYGAGSCRDPCADFADPGEPCVVNGVPDCFGDHHCREEGPGTETGHCVPNPGLGEDCMFSPCREGYCDSETWLCVPIPELGEPCSWRCVEGAYCDASAAEPRCVPFRAAGEPCDASLGNCVVGTYCDATSDPPICTPTRPEGSPCDASGQCGQGCNAGVCEDPTPAVCPWQLYLPPP